MSEATVAVVATLSCDDRPSSALRCAEDPSIPTGSPATDTSLADAHVIALRCRVVRRK
jgi:hypothetical protein